MDNRRNGVLPAPPSVSGTDQGVKRSLLLKKRVLGSADTLENLSELSASPLRCDWSSCLAYIRVGDNLQLQSGLTLIAQWDSTSQLVIDFITWLQIYNSRIRWSRRSHFKGLPFMLPMANNTWGEKPAISFTLHFFFSFVGIRYQYCVINLFLKDPLLFQVWALKVMTVCKKFKPLIYCCLRYKVAIETLQRYIYYF